jgi:hypothetical protein
MPPPGHCSHHQGSWHPVLDDRRRHRPEIEPSPSIQVPGLLEDVQRRVSQLVCSRGSRHHRADRGSGRGRLGQDRLAQRRALVTDPGAGCDLAAWCRRPRRSATVGLWTQPRPRHQAGTSPPHVGVSRPSRSTPRQRVSPQRAKLSIWRSGCRTSDGAAHQSPLGRGVPARGGARAATWQRPGDVHWTALRRLLVTDLVLRLLERHEIPARGGMLIESGGVHGDESWLDAVEADVHQTSGRVLPELSADEAAAADIRVRRSRPAGRASWSPCPADSTTSGRRICRRGHGSRSPNRFRSTPVRSRPAWNCWQHRCTSRRGTRWRATGPQPAGCSPGGRPWRTGGPPNQARSRRRTSPRSTLPWTRGWTPHARSACSTRSSRTPSCVRATSWSPSLPSTRSWPWRSPRPRRPTAMSCCAGCIPGHAVPSSAPRGSAHQRTCCQGSSQCSSSCPYGRHARGGHERAGLPTGVAFTVLVRLRSPIFVPTDDWMHRAHDQLFTFDSPTGTRPCACGWRTPTAGAAATPTRGWTRWTRRRRTSRCCSTLAVAAARWRATPSAGCGRCHHQDRSPSPAPGRHGASQRPGSSCSRADPPGRRHRQLPLPVTYARSSAVQSSLSDP